MRTVTRLNKMKKDPSKAALLLMFMVHVISGDTLTCDVSEFKIDRRCCRLCPAGTCVKLDCFGDQTTSCEPCREGTYMNQPTYRRRCHTCSNCDAVSGLKTKTLATAKSDTVCEALQGFFCVDRTKDGCRAAQKHKRCEPGQYISQNGTADRDTVCSDCSEGTFSDGTLMFCLPHTQCDSPELLMKAGTSSADAECEEESSNSAAVVIGAVVPVLVICAVVAVIIFLRQKKRLRGRAGKAIKLKKDGGGGGNMMEVKRLQKDDPRPDRAVRIQI